MRPVWRLEICAQTAYIMKTTRVMSDDLIESLPLSKIRSDGDTQPRTEVLDEVVDAYRRDMRKGAVFPPVEVVFDGQDYWLFDGFHRVKAAWLAHKQTLQAIIHKGTKEDAAWRSLAANAVHGLRRSNADKVWAIERALKMRPDRSNRFLAEHVGVDNKTVGMVRGKLESTEEIPHLERLRGRDGRWRSARARFRVPAYPWPQEEFIPSSWPWNCWYRKFRRECPSVRRLPDYDYAGHRIASHGVEHIREVFNSRGEIADLVKRAERLQEDILMCYERRGPVFADFNWKRVDEIMEEAVHRLREICPHSICPGCQGAGCDACGKRGWVSKEVYAPAPAWLGTPVEVA